VHCGLSSPFSEFDGVEMLKVTLIGLFIGVLCYFLKLPPMTPPAREGIMGIVALYVGYFELPKLINWLFIKFR
jgi:XapX domain-containing protein